MHLSAKWLKIFSGFSTEEATAAASLTFTFKELSSQEGCLDFQNEKHMVSYVLSGQGLASLLLTVMEFQFTGNELHPLSLGPIYLLPQAQTSSFCHTLYTESQQCG